jgi:hypothetical protein
VPNPNHDNNALCLHFVDRQNGRHIHHIHHKSQLTTEALIQVDDRRVMNADQIKRKRELRRSHSSGDGSCLAKILQRQPPSRSKSSGLGGVVGRRIIKTEPAFDRQISFLGMEDDLARPRRYSRGVKLGEDMTLSSDYDYEQSSVASDPTANEDNDGIDMDLFHASLSAGSSTGWSADNSSTDCISAADGMEGESPGKHTQHTNHPSMNCTQRSGMPKLCLPSQVNDVNTSLKTLNLHDALEICKRLDAEELQEFNEQQQQQRRRLSSTRYHSGGAPLPVMILRNDIGYMADTLATPKETICLQKTDQLLESSQRILPSDTGRQAVATSPQEYERNP